MSKQYEEAQRLLESALDKLDVDSGDIQEKSSERAQDPGGEVGPI